MFEILWWFDPSPVQVAVLTYQTAGTYSIPFSPTYDLSNVRVTAGGPDGNKVSSTNGGGGARETVGGDASGFGWPWTVSISAAGSETATGVDDGVLNVITASSGFNGDEGGAGGAINGGGSDLLSLISETAGTDNSVTGTGQDGYVSITFALKALLPYQGLSLGLSLGI